MDTCWEWKDVSVFVVHDGIGFITCQPIISDIKKMYLLARYFVVLWVAAMFSESLAVMPIFLCKSTWWTSFRKESCVSQCCLYNLKSLNVVLKFLKHLPYVSFFRIWFDTWLRFSQSEVARGSDLFFFSFHQSYWFLRVTFIPLGRNTKQRNDSQRFRHGFKAESTVHVVFLACYWDIS